MNETKWKIIYCLILPKVVHVRGYCSINGGQSWIGCADATVTLPLWEDWMADHKAAIDRGKVELIQEDRVGAHRLANSTVGVGGQ